METELPFTAMELRNGVAGLIWMVASRETRRPNAAMMVGSLQFVYRYFFKNRLVSRGLIRNENMWETADRRPTRTVCRVIHSYDHIFSDIRGALLKNEMEFFIEMESITRVTFRNQIL